MVGTDTTLGERLHKLILSMCSWYVNFMHTVRPSRPVAMGRAVSEIGTQQKAMTSEQQEQRFMCEKKRALR